MRKLIGTLCAVFMLLFAVEASAQCVTVDRLTTCRSTVAVPVSALSVPVGESTISVGTVGADLLSLYSQRIQRSSYTTGLLGDQPIGLWTQRIGQTTSTTGYIGTQNVSLWTTDFGLPRYTPPVRSYLLPPP